MPLYVYYKVAAAKRSEAKAEVDRILVWARQQRMTGRLLRRPEVLADGRETWMEVYETAPANFGAELETFASTTRLSEYASARRVEIFEVWQ